MRIEPLPAIFSVNIDNLIAVPSGTVGNIFPTGRNINDILFLLFFPLFFFFFFLIIILFFSLLSLSLSSFFFLFFILFIFFFRRNSTTISRQYNSCRLEAFILPHRASRIYEHTYIGERSRDNPIKSIIPWGIFHCRNIDESSTETSDSI